MTAAATLSARNVGMVFGGVVALAGAEVQVQSGRIVGLIGRNGSGKSTLFNCMTGFLVPTTGRIEVDGKDLTGLEPHSVVRHGVARTFQTPRLDLSARVFDAVLAGFFLKYRAGLLASMLSWPTARHAQQRLESETEDLLLRLDLDDARDEEIGKLSMGRVRLVEVARSIAAGARFLLLDEPAAGLTPPEVGQLAQQIRQVAQTEIGVLLVEHNFAMIEALCDRVTVLESGSVLYEGPTAQVRQQQDVISSYLGGASAANVARSVQ